jgi:hypothetical protein
VCEECDFRSMKTWTDVLWPFRLEAEEYYDRPFGGWAYCKKCGAKFAFASSPIVHEVLVHWAFIAASIDSDDFKRVFDEARKKAHEEWISVLEDRRVVSSRPYSGVVVSAPVPLPPWQW